MPPSLEDVTGSAEGQETGTAERDCFSFMSQERFHKALNVCLGFHWILKGRQLGKSFKEDDSEKENLFTCHFVSLSVGDG